MNILIVTWLSLMKEPDSYWIVPCLWSCCTETVLYLTTQYKETLSAASFKLAYCTFTSVCADVCCMLKRECASLREEVVDKGGDQSVCLIMICFVSLRQAHRSWVRFPSIPSSLPIPSPSVVLWFWVCLVFSDGCWGFEPRSLCLLSKCSYLSHRLSQLLLCFFLKVIHTIICDYIHINVHIGHLSIRL